MRTLIGPYLVQEMPELARFWGIIFRMFTETGAQHHVPYLHAYYQDHQAIYRIDTVELLAGFLPRRQQRLVEAWIELYQAELRENWDLVQASEPIRKVPPLRREERQAMTHLMVQVKDFVVVGLYTLHVTFDDGAEQTINFEPVLYGHYYAPLRDLDVFNQVRLDPEIHTLVWPNGADLDPATLYNWHRGDGAELAKKAARWRKAQAGVAARVS